MTRTEATSIADLIGDRTLVDMPDRLRLPFAGGEAAAASRGTFAAGRQH